MKHLGKEDIKKTLKTVGVVSKSERQHGAA